MKFHYLILPIVIFANLNNSRASSPIEAFKNNYFVNAERFSGESNELSSLFAGDLMGIFSDGDAKLPLKEKIPGSAAKFIPWVVERVNIEAKRNGVLLESILHRWDDKVSPAVDSGLVDSVGSIDFSSLAKCANNAVPKLRNILGAVIEKDLADETRGWLELSEITGDSQVELTAGKMPCGSKLGKLRLKFSKLTSSERIAEQVIVLSVLLRAKSRTEEQRSSVLQALWFSFGGSKERTKSNAVFWSEYWSYLSVEMLLKASGAIQSPESFAKANASWVNLNDINSDQIIYKKIKEDEGF